MWVALSLSRSIFLFVSLALAASRHDWGWFRSPRLSGWAQLSCCVAASVRLCPALWTRTKSRIENHLNLGAEWSLWLVTVIGIASGPGWLDDSNGTGLQRDRQVTHRNPLSPTSQLGILVWTWSWWHKQSKKRQKSQSGLAYPKFLRRSVIPSCLTQSLSSFLAPLSLIALPWWKRSFNGGEEHSNRKEASPK